LSKKQFEELMSRVGTTSDNELILYGDFNNWFAAFAFWVFDYYGHKKLRMMIGGRKKNGRQKEKSIRNQFRALRIQGIMQPHRMKG